MPMLILPAIFLVVYGVGYGAVTIVQDQFLAPAEQHARAIGDDEHDHDGGNNF